MHQKRLPLPAPSAKGIVPPTRFALRAHPTISLTLMVPPFTWTRASTPLGGTMPLTSCCHFKTSQVLATTVAGLGYYRRRCDIFARSATVFGLPALPASQVSHFCHTCDTFALTPATLLPHTCSTSRTPATLLLTPAALRAQLRHFCSHLQHFAHTCDSMQQKSQASNLAL